MKVDRLGGGDRTVQRKIEEGKKQGSREKGERKSRRMGREVATATLNHFWQRCSFSPQIFMTLSFFLNQLIFTTQNKISPKTHIH